MKVTVLDFNSDALVGSVSVEQKELIFSSSVKLLNSIIGLSNKLESSKGDIDSSIDFIIDCDSFFAEDLKVLKEANVRLVSSTSGLRRRLRRVIESYNTLKADLEYNCQTFLPLDDEQYDNVSTVLDGLMGNLACYLYHQFNLSDYLKEDYDEISDVLDLYVRRNKLEFIAISGLAVQCRSLMDAHAPSIGVLEKYPEYAEPFSELAGEDLYDCEFITLDVVKDLVSGRMTVQEFREFVTEQLEYGE